MTVDQSSPAGSGNETPLADLLPLYRSLWKRRVLILICGLVAALVSLGYSFLMPQIYTARVSILPRQEKASSDLLGQIASFTGASLEGGGSFETLYEEIIQSDRVLAKVLSRQWDSTAFSEPVGFDQILGFPVTAGNEDSRRYSDYRVKKKLREKVISVSRDKMTGYTVLKVGLDSDPGLAAELANFLVRELDAFLKDFRSAKATQNRVFVEDRLITTTRELKAAESKLTGFVLNNRSYAASPQLLEEYRGLEREVAAQSSIWVELRRQLETSRIDEHRNSIRIDVLDWAEPPLIRTSPRRKNMLIGGGVLGVCLAAVFVLGREQFRKISGSIQE